MSGRARLRVFEYFASLPHTASKRGMPRRRMCRCYGPQSNYADSGLFKALASWISVRSPHAARAAPPRKRRAAGTVLLQHRQRHHLRNRVACGETDQLACRVRDGDGCSRILLHQPQRLLQGGAIANGENR